MLFKPVLSSSSFPCRLQDLSGQLECSRSSQSSRCPLPSSSTTFRLDRVAAAASSKIAPFLHQRNTLSKLWKAKRRVIFLPGILSQRSSSVFAEFMSSSWATILSIIPTESASSVEYMWPNINAFSVSRCPITSDIVHWNQIGATIPWKCGKERKTRLKLLCLKNMKFLPILSRSSR